jgi:uncharacterized protein YehS (DUF1456 family)
MESAYLNSRLKEIDSTGAYNVNGRKEKFTQQLMEQGFHDGDTFDLFTHLSKLILPRLKRFKEVHCGYPGYLTARKWNNMLNKMILAFELLTQDKVGYSEVEEKSINSGLELFGKHFRNLWW